MEPSGLLQLYPTLSSDPDLQRLINAVALGEGFQFHILACAEPLVASAALELLRQEVAQLLHTAVSVLYLSPYLSDSRRERPRQAAPEQSSRGTLLTYEQLAEYVLRPLVSPRAATANSGPVIVVIDATWASQADEVVWLPLFQRMNEVRNTIAQRCPGALILCVSPGLERAFAQNAPDFWSIRGALVHVPRDAWQSRLEIEMWTEDWEPDTGVDRRPVFAVLSSLPQAEFVAWLRRIHLPQTLKAVSPYVTRDVHAREILRYFSMTGRMAELVASLEAFRRPRATGWRHWLSPRFGGSPASLPRPPETAGPSGMMPDLTILHISDLHMSKDRLSEQRGVFRAFLRDLEQLMQQHDLHIDIVCLTGDIAYTAHPEEYALAAANVLEPLLKVLRLSRERLFCVPGNHDIDWDVVAQQGWLAEGVKAALQDPNAVDELLADHRLRGQILQRMGHYTTFTRAFFGSEVDEEMATLHTTRVLSLGNIRLGVACINSAWHGQRQGQGPAFLGVQQLVMTRRALTSTDLRLLLLHHPLAALHLHETDTLADFCGREFHLILHGHVHTEHIPVGARIQQALISAGRPLLAHPTSPGLRGYTVLQLGSAPRIYLRRYTPASRTFVAEGDFSLVPSPVEPSPTSDRHQV